MQTQLNTKKLENNIGYIQITSFDEETAESFKHKFEELKNQGITSLIIDLRNNGGGLVSEATQIADFIRRSAELLGIIMAFVVYQITTKDGVCDEARKARLEQFSNIFVGAMMCIGGSFMIFSASVKPIVVPPDIQVFSYIR